MKVKDVLDKHSLYTLKPEDCVIDFISLIEQKRVHEALVVNEKGELIGFVHYRILAQKSVQDPTQTKIETVMIHPPKINENEDVENAIEFLFKTGFRALPVVNDKEKAVGIFSVFDALRAVKNCSVFEKTAEEIMSPAVVIHKDEDIGKARVMMREKNISRLPVVDDEDKLVGEITVLDLLKAVQPKERISWYSMAAEKLTMMNTPVSSVMNTTPLTAEKRTKIKEIIDKMLEIRKRGCIVVENNEPLGVVTVRDILELWLTSKKKESGIYIQYSGLEEEDDFVMDTVDRIVSDTVEKIHSIYPVEYFHVHVKRYRKSGERKLFSVRCRVMTSKGVFISHAQAWDLRDAVDEATDKLEKIVIKHKEKLETTHKPRGA